MSKVDCEITFLEGGQFGHFANAFRVVDDSGPDCFLDFLLYNYNENRAVIVSRIKISKDFIPSIRLRLEEAFSEISHFQPELAAVEQEIMQEEYINNILGLPAINIFNPPKDKN
jgi:hypothetical protein